MGRKGAAEQRSKSDNVDSVKGCISALRRCEGQDGVGRGLKQRLP